MSQRQSDVVSQEVYWAQGLECFDEGQDVISAIQEIAHHLLPPHGLNTLATIIGSLYADVYWNKVEMDCKALANDLRLAINADLSDARKAAVRAFRHWSGLLVRPEFGSDGIVPKRGALTLSPDILVGGQARLTPDRIINQWNRTEWGPVSTALNFASARALCHRTWAPIRRPTVRVFQCENALNPPPDTWEPLRPINQTLWASELVNEKGGSTLRRGEKAASKEVFAIQPPGEGHFSLIALAGSEYFANLKPPSGLGNIDLVTWLANNGAAGWHNFNRATGGELPLKFYNPDDTPERFVFTVHCGNLAKGSEVALCSDEVGLRASATIDKLYHEINAEVEVPPNFEGELLVVLPELPANALIDCQLSWRVPTWHRDYLRATSLAGKDVARLSADGVIVPLGSTFFFGSMD